MGSASVKAFKCIHTYNRHMSINIGNKLYFTFYYFNDCDYQTIYMIIGNRSWVKKLKTVKIVAKICIYNEYFTTNQPCDVSRHLNILWHA